LRLHTGIFDNDVIIVTSLVLRTQSVTSILPSSSCKVLNCIASEQVQQAKEFKHQTLTFHFSTYRPKSCKYLSHHTPITPTLRPTTTM